MSDYPIAAVQCVHGRDFGEKCPMEDRAEAKVERMEKLLRLQVSEIRSNCGRDEAQCLASRCVRDGYCNVTRILAALGE